MDDRLQTAKWKLGRAHQHIQAAVDLMTWFLRSDFFRTENVQHSDGHLLWRVVECKPFPPAFGLLVGDAAHNLRATLDHLMFAIAQPKNAREELRVQFPIFSDEERFRNRADEKMPGVSLEARNLVESLQPYHAAARPRTKLLQQIQDIDNWDKHRSLLISMMSIDVNSLNLTHTGASGEIAKVETFEVKVERGAILSRIELGGYWNVGDQIKMNPDAYIRPVFDSNMPASVKDLGVIRILEEAARFIDFGVMPQFNRFVKPDLRCRPS